MKSEMPFDIPTLGEHLAGQQRRAYPRPGHNKTAGRKLGPRKQAERLPKNGAPHFVRDLPGHDLVVGAACLRYDAAAGGWQVPGGAMVSDPVQALRVGVRLHERLTGESV